MLLGELVRRLHRAITRERREVIADNRRGMLGKYAVG